MALILGAGFLAVAPPLLAQPSAQTREAEIAFDIPGGTTARALNDFAAQANLQILFPYEVAAASRTAPLKGRFTRQQALERLLADGPFEIASQTDTMITLREKPQAAVDTETMAEVVVTGSRLKRPNFESPVPVVSVDSAEVADEGHMDLAEALAELPGVSHSASLSNNQSSAQNSGTSTLNLRGMGQQRTLTLIDGRRTVSNAGNRNIVSLSTIPTFFVQRVDITTGGASAVYGSDAIAGVVNIITRSEYDGFRVRGVVGTTEDGGGESSEISFLGGRKFLDDRLSVLVTGTWERQEALMATDRDWATRSIAYSQATNTVTDPDMSSYTEGGRYGGSAYYFHFDENNQLQRNFDTLLHGDDTRNYGTLITPRINTNAAVKAAYDISDTLKLSGLLSWSHITTKVIRAPLGYGHGSTYGKEDEFEVGRVNRANPYLVAQPEIYSTTGSSGLQWRRRFSELGDRYISNARTTVRGLIALDGKAFGDWDWQLSYAFGDFIQDQHSLNGINLQNLSYAIKATTVDGEIVCLDATARANGCVPVDLFGHGAITPQMADYIRGNGWYHAKNRQDSAAGHISGSPFSLPAGPVDVAAGFEIRRDKTATYTDDLTEQGGLLSFSYIPRYSGSVNVQEAYVEASAPLLRNRPFAYRWNVDAAARVAKYDLSGVDSTASYRVGMQWAPVRAVNFRTTWARAQRAPDIAELFSPPRDDNDTVSDVCSGVTATTPGVIADNCRSDPGIAAAIAADGVFTQDGSSINAPNSGNPDLKEETADTFTFGVVLAPRFLRGFNASIDYYDIEVTDVITSLSNNTLLHSCYSDVNGTANAFCDTITRNGEGQLVRMINEMENLDSMRARGVDVAVGYRFDLNGRDIPGRFDLRVNYTRLLKMEQTYQTIDGPETNDSLGEIGDSEHEARTSLTWRNQGLMLRWSTSVIGAAVDSNERRALHAAQGVTDPLFFYAKTWYRHDLSFSYRPAGHSNLRVFGALRNVFDRYGPFLPDGTDSGNEFNYDSIYGVSGRSFSLGIEYDF